MILPNAPRLSRVSLTPLAPTPITGRPHCGGQRFESPSSTRKSAQTDVISSATE